MKSIVIFFDRTLSRDRDKCNSIMKEIEAGSYRMKVLSFQYRYYELNGFELDDKFRDIDEATIIVGIYGIAGPNSCNSLRKDVDSIFLPLTYAKSKGKEVVAFDGGTNERFWKVQQFDELKYIVNAIFCSVNDLRAYLLGRDVQYQIDMEKKGQ